MAFWENFEKECANIGKKPNPVGKDIGVSSGTITKWKNGSIPSGEILQRLSRYFNVSVDYLLGSTMNRNLQLDKELTDIDFALCGEIHELTDAEKQDILDYIRFKRTQKDGK